MRVGVLGGTFDPIHLGHLRAAESVREALGLDEVLFVPAHVPPHREAPGDNARGRFAMVCLATASHPAFRASDVELRRDGPSFTVDTLRALASERPADELVLVIGSDAYGEMDSWKDARQVASLCEVAVVGRPGDESPGRQHEALAPVRVDGPGLHISATQIRALVREGKSVRYLVPESVAEFIQKEGLYR